MMGDARLQGFRSKSAEVFEQYLLDEGYRDRRPRLGERDVVARVMATPAASRVSAAVDGEMVRRWWALSGR